MTTINGIMVPKFDGLNYINWSKRMLHILATRDVWSLVENGYEEPIPYDLVVGLTEKQQKEYKEIVRKYNEALSIIFSAMEDNVFIRVNEAKTSKEAWDTLKTIYQGETTAKLQMLRRNFEI
eukprot:Gb_24100 [translate_table: standard]